MNIIVEESIEKTTILATEEKIIVQVNEDEVILNVNEVLDSVQIGIVENIERLSILTTEEEVVVQVTELSNPIQIGVSETSIPGMSAYEVAIKNGFVGTEQEWLDSLGNNNINSYFPSGW